MARNDRLAAAMSEAGLSASAFASRLGVDAKTVERWRNGVVPHPRTQVKVAAELGVLASLLWPSVDRASNGDAPTVTAYPSRRSIPLGLWRTLMADCEQNFDLLAYAATFLPDQMDLGKELVALADRGVRVRLLLGDPYGVAVSQRSKEEGVSGLHGRIDLVLAYLRKEKALMHPGVEVRLHDTTLYTSLYRFDDDLLANTHILGRPAAMNPVLHLRQPRDQVLVDAYADGFDTTWADAVRVTNWPPPAEARASPSPPADPATNGNRPPGEQVGGQGAADLSEPVDPEVVMFLRRAPRSPHGEVMVDLSEPHPDLSQVEPAAPGGAVHMDYPDGENHPGVLRFYPARRWL